MDALKITELDDLGSITAYHYNGHNNTINVYKLHEKEVREKVFSYKWCKYTKFRACIIDGDNVNGKGVSDVVYLCEKEGDIHNGYFWLRDRDDKKSKTGC